MSEFQKGKSIINMSAELPLFKELSEKSHSVTSIFIFFYPGLCHNVVLVYEKLGDVFLAKHIAPQLKSGFH